MRKIFSLCSQDGMGIRRIAQRLNQDGYRTRRGRNWSMVTIRDLLRNPVYIGRYEKSSASACPTTTRPSYPNPTSRRSPS